MAYNQVIISSGHSINCQGASDIVNEVTEARKVVDRVHDIITASGKKCYSYHDTASSSRQNLYNIVAFHNKYSEGIDVSVHFNACNHTDSPRGVEVCYKTTNSLATSVSKAIAVAGGLQDRGAKFRDGLYFLNHTNKKAILIEVCFCDSTADCNLYKANFEDICQAIAKALIGDIAVAEAPTVNVETPPIIESTPELSPVDEAKAFVGSRCKELQEKLIACGYSCGGYGADGIFGNATYLSLVAFQKDHGLVADGLAGDKTFAKLNEVLTPKTTRSFKDWVKALQTECNNQGFSDQTVDGIPGPATLRGCPVLHYGARGNITKLLQERLGVEADGIFGNDTKEAVISFQKSNGLVADYVVGEKTWRKLLNL